MPNPPAPVVPFFEAGYPPGKPDFDSWIYDNFWFLATRVVFRGRQAVTAQPISTTVFGTIELDTIDEDPYGGWNASTFAWTAPYNGWYQVTVTGFAATLAQPGVLFSGVAGPSNTYSLTEQNVQAVHGQGTECTFWVYMLGGQDSAAAVVAYQGVATSPMTSITAGQQCAMECVWASY